VGAPSFSRFFGEKAGAPTQASFAWVGFFVSDHRQLLLIRSNFRVMPWALTRDQRRGDLHFVTFSCYRHGALLASAHAEGLFERALEQARRQCGFWVSGYVIMPEHLHLLVSEPGTGGWLTVLQTIHSIST
jgi:Transposase IS200 like